MAPPPQPSPVTPHSRSLIKRALPLLHEGGGGGGGRRGGNHHHHHHHHNPSVPERSSSFHGRIIMSPSSDPNKQLQQIMCRPKTQPDLLTGGAGAEWRKLKEARTQSKSSLGDRALKLKRLEAGAATSGSSSSSQIVERKVPAKVLVNVNVQRSLGAVQVMASTEWSVEDLISATLKQYVKEGRRPLLLPISSASSFGLHYSQFSLESLDPKEKLIGLGSRNFFLCPNSSSSLTPSTTCLSAAAAAAAAASSTSSTTTSSSCFKEADNASKTTFSWLRFKQLLS